MNSITDAFRIYNGVDIPCMGLGTWQSDDQTAKLSVLSALSHGYRLVDTAAAYGNERGVGAGIRESGLNRADIFVTSKLRNSSHGYRATMQQFDMTLDKLGLDYLDLYLIHWPNPVQYRRVWKSAMQETWRAFEELYRAGKIRAIGVSNFMPHHIDALMETATILPMVNQLKLCPGVTQPEIVDYCNQKGIVVEAYSPFGTGAIFESEVMNEMAIRYHKTVGQLCLRWCLEMNFVSLPKSANPMRIKQNTEIFDFCLTREDMDAISKLEGICGPAPDPDQILF